MHLVRKNKWSMLCSIQLWRNNFIIISPFLGQMTGRIPPAKERGELCSTWTERWQSRVIWTDSHYRCAWNRLRQSRSQSHTWSVSGKFEGNSSPQSRHRDPSRFDSAWATKKTEKKMESSGSSDRLVTPEWASHRRIVWVVMWQNSLTICFHLILAQYELVKRSRRFFCNSWQYLMCIIGTIVLDTENV